MLIWAIKDGYIIRILGFSINSDLPLNDYAPKNLSKIEALLTLAESIGVPLLYIHQIETTTTIKFAKIIHDQTKLRAQRYEVPIGTFVDKVQGIFGTNYSHGRSVKPINKSAHDWFHEWSRLNFPSEYIKNDADIITFADNKAVTVVVEVKRSFQPEDWSPFRADEKNYALQIALAQKIGAKALLIEHQKETLINDTTNVAFFDLHNINTGPVWLDYTKEIITAKEAVTRIDR